VRRGEGAEPEQEPPLGGPEQGDIAEPGEPLGGSHPTEQGGAAPRGGNVGVEDKEGHEGGLRHGPRAPGSGTGGRGEAGVQRCEGSEGQGGGAGHQSSRGSIPAAVAASAKAAARLATVSWAFRPDGLGTTHSSAPARVSGCRPAVARGRRNAVR